MSSLSAIDLLRRLRSNGVKVYLDDLGQVTFSSLDDVNPAIKIQIISLGRALQRRLKEEQKIRQQRQECR